MAGTRVPRGTSHPRSWAPPGSDLPPHRVLAERIGCAASYVSLLLSGKRRSERAEAGQERGPAPQLRPFARRGDFAKRT